MPIVNDTDVVKYYVTNEKWFDAIRNVHLQTGHGGRNKMEKAISEKYANITRKSITTYLELFLICGKTVLAKKRTTG